jgi:uncharacterized protein (TIGR02099 family)
MGHLISFITRLVSLTLVLLALAVVGMRIGLANIDHFENEIKNWLSSEIASGISFVDIHGGWNQFNPILRLENAAVVLPNQDRPISVDEMAVEIDLIKSIWVQTLVIREVSGAIKNLQVKKDVNGHWWLNDAYLGGSGTSNSNTSIATLVSKIPHYLDLELKQLGIVDQTTGDHYELDWVQLDLQQRDGSVHLELATLLPESLGQQLTIKSIIKPDTSLVYLDLRQLKLTRLAQLLDIDTAALEQAELSGELWINLLDEEFVGLSGALSLSDGLVRAKTDSRPYDFSVSSEINAQRNQDNWSVSALVKELKVNNKSLRSFNSEFRITGNKLERRVAGWIDAFELYNLRVLDDRILPVAIADVLQKSELQGELSNIWFSLDPAAPDNIRFSAEASNIASRPANGIPGLGYLDASIVFGNSNAAINLSGDHMTLDFVDQFRAPLDVENFKMNTNISLVGDDFIISAPAFEIANDDLRGSGRLWLEANKLGRPFMYLRASFADARGSSTSKYVPVKLMPRKVIDWIDQGIKNADVPHGDLLYHGRLKSIKKLIDDRAGELVVDFQVQNAEVLFDKNWPVARNGEGRVIFHNLGVDVTLNTVSLEAVESGVASVSIADFRQAEIAVDVATTATTDIALQTWINTPVGNKYESIVKGFRNVDGEVDAKISILLPISDPERQPQVDVSLAFSNSTVDAPAWGLNLTGVNGSLQVTEQSLKANSMQANFFGDPIEVDIYTQTKTDRTMVQARGNIQSQELLRLLPDYLGDGIQGKSDWQIEIGITNKPATAKNPIVEINAKSEMLNTEVLFPAPFRKVAGGSRASQVQVAIYDNNQVDFNLSYGVGVMAQGAIAANDQGVSHLQNLGLGFSTALRPMTSPGINIYGSLRQLPLDEWFEYYRSRIVSKGAKASDLVELMDSINLEVQSTSLFGNKLVNSYLNMKRHDNGFSADVESSMLKGKFEIPLQHSPTDPIVAKLDYLRLQSSQTESESTGLYPEDLFNLQLTSKILSYDEMVFSDLRFDARLEGDELTIDKLAFRNNQVQLESTASWQYTPDTEQHHSAANISIVGAEFGQSMASLGLGDSMQDGNILLDGQVRWSGELLKLDWESLVGDATLQVTNGFLRNVDPGSGRIVGLLSLSALPRRLSLDFNDVLLEGLNFDKIVGTYNIEGEDIYTSNTRMESPSAKIDISGRVGLLARDYDQKMVITPRIRHSLPLIGGLAVSAGVGWGLLLLQNLFKDVIDKSVQAEYRITGTWTEPQVDLVKKVVLEKVKIDK